MKNQSNDLRFTASKTVGNEVITVKIRLNDECKNGHQDFSITGDIFKAGKARVDQNCISSGCIHEDILKHFPEFTQFVKLHLADATGIPMYAVENGFYHLHNGFNNTKVEDKNFPSEFCDYYRITQDQFNRLKECRNKLQYALQLDKLGILAQWKKEADAAILVLENLTGVTFVNDSVKSQYHAPSQEQLNEEAKKKSEGYYTPEAEAQREEDKKQSILDELEANLNKEIAKHKLEYEVKKEVFLKGGEKALNNCIFYNHTKQLAFNWKSYELLSVDFINSLIPTLILPEGVTAAISTK